MSKRDVLQLFVDICLVERGGTSTQFSPSDTKRRLAVRRVHPDARKTKTRRVRDHRAATVEDVEEPLSLARNLRDTVIRRNPEYEQSIHTTRGATTRLVFQRSARLRRGNFSAVSSGNLSALPSTRREINVGRIPDCVSGESVEHETEPRTLVNNLVSERRATIAVITGEQSGIKKRGRD